MGLGNTVFNVAKYQSPLWWGTNWVAGPTKADEIYGGAANLAMGVGGAGLSAGALIAAGPITTLGAGAAFLFETLNLGAGLYQVGEGASQLLGAFFGGSDAATPVTDPLYNSTSLLQGPGIPNSVLVNPGQQNIEDLATQALTDVTGVTTTLSLPNGLLPGKAAPIVSLGVGKAVSSATPPGGQNVGVLNTEGGFQAPRGGTYMVTTVKGGKYNNNPYAGAPYYEYTFPAGNGTFTTVGTLQKPTMANGNVEFDGATTILTNLPPSMFPPAGPNGQPQFILNPAGNVAPPVATK